MGSSLLAPSAEVADAIATGKPVVALESTIITHGMPHPQNVETARSVEATIRRRGAIPATIAVLDGQMKVGLGDDDLDRLGRDIEAEKVSRRDLAFVLHRRSVGGTTVAATMLIAAQAGIEVFATGGIGGVHRGGGLTFDVSADLQELARTTVTVVCAGMKSILDLGLTLEYLETHSVPVVGYRTDVLPAFYARRSDFPVPHRLDTAAEIAEIMAIREASGTAGGMVIANPIPEAAALDEDEMAAFIAQAVAEADADGIVGKDATPYLLARLVELTGSRSLDANIALVHHNAEVAAEIAIARAASQPA